MANSLTPINHSLKIQNEVNTSIERYKKSDNELCDSACRFDSILVCEMGLEIAHGTVSTCNYDAEKVAHIASSYEATFS